MFLVWGTRWRQWGFCVKTPYSVCFYSTHTNNNVYKPRLNKKELKPINSARGIFSHLSIREYIWVEYKAKEDPYFYPISGGGDENLNELL